MHFRASVATDHSENTQKTPSWLACTPKTEVRLVSQAQAKKKCRLNLKFDREQRWRCCLARPIWWHVHVTPSPSQCCLVQMHAPNLLDSSHNPMTGYSHKHTFVCFTFCSLSEFPSPIIISTSISSSIRHQEMFDPCGYADAVSHEEGG
jgi:hypothetical protein